MKPRIAIYGRHSTDKQNPESTNDQAETCKRVVDYLGGDVVDLYLDPEVSGYRRDRPGLRRLLADVRYGRIDVVVCEAMDRIARDAEDIAWLGKKLKFSRVRMHTVAENEIDDIKLAVASMLGSIFLSQLQQKTLRGMHAAVLAGRFAGGRAPMGIARSTASTSAASRYAAFSRSPNTKRTSSAGSTTSSRPAARPETSPSA